MSTTTLEHSARQAFDSLLDHFSPHHFLSSRTSAKQQLPPSTTATARTRRNSVASSLASVRTAFSHLLVPSSPRPASIHSTRSVYPPLLSLPPELLLYIFSLALPPSHDRWNTPTRNHTLRSLSLVHPMLRPWAQGELFHNPVVLSDRAVERLMGLAMEKQTRGAGMARGVTSLRVYGNRATGEGRLPSLPGLVQALTGLETLHLEDLDGLELRAFVLHPALKTLTSTRCNFRSRFRAVATSTPSPLVTLSLTNCTAHDDALSGFTLPHLLHLVIHDVYLPPPSPLAILEASDAIKRLAPSVARQLKSLEMDELHFGFFFPLTYPTGREGSTIELEKLTLVKLSSAFTSMLDTLPPHNSLHTLHLIPPTSFVPSFTSTERSSLHFASLLTPFRTSAPSFPPALRKLNVLALDARYATWLDAGAEAGEDLKELLRRVEERGGVEVRWEVSRVESGRRRPTIARMQGGGSEGGADARWASVGGGVAVRAGGGGGRGGRSREV